MWSFLTRTCLVGLAVTVVVSDGSIALAQASRRPPMRRYRSTVAEPFVSPYLNLARPGADPGFNYFTLVQPQLQQQRNTQLQGNQIQGLGNEVQEAKMGAYGPVGKIRPTGRGATYQNYSHFYPSLGGAGRGGQARNYRSSSAGSGMGGIGIY